MRKLKLDEKNEYDTIIEGNELRNDLNKLLIEFNKGKNGNIQNYWNSLKKICEIYTNLKEYENSLNYFQKGIDLLGEIENTEEKVDFLLNFGYTLYLNESYYESIEKYNESLTLINKHNIIEKKVKCLTYLGKSYYFLGLIEKSQEILNESLKEFEKNKEIQKSGNILNIIAETYRFLGIIDGISEKYESAIKKIKTGIEILGENNPKIKIKLLDQLGQIYLDYKKYKQALKYFAIAREQSKKINDKEGESNILNNIAIIYEESSTFWHKKHKIALKTYQESFDLITGKNSNAAIVLSNIARLNKYLKNKKEAENTFVKAINIVSNSENPQDIISPLNQLSDLNSKLSIEKAKESLNGILWLHYVLDEYKMLGIEYWRGMWEANELFWNYFVKKSELLNNNWKAKQITQNLELKTSQETKLNYLIGLNDINEKKIQNSLKLEQLKDEEIHIQPAWFIEFPKYIKHEEKYLKIRLNNLIEINSYYQGYPVPNKEANSIDYKQIKRIRGKIETDWLKEYTFDNEFYPNTQEEFKAYEKEKEKAWLKDVILFDLEEQQKIKKFLEFKITLELFLEKEHEPIKITSNEICLKVIRKNKVQEIERLLKKNNNLLAVILAFSSIFISIVSNLDRISIVFPILNNIFGLSNLEFLLLITILALFPLGYYLFKNQTNQIIKEKFYIKERTKE